MLPSAVTLYLCGVWFCAGFFTAAGWYTGSWVVAHTLGRL